MRDLEEIGEQRVPREELLVREYAFLAGLSMQDNQRCKRISVLL